MSKKLNFDFVYDHQQSFSSVIRLETSTRTPNEHTHTHTHTDISASERARKAAAAAAVAAYPRHCVYARVYLSVSVSFHFFFNFSRSFPSFHSVIILNSLWMILSVYGGTLNSFLMSLLLLFSCASFVLCRGLLLLQNCVALFIIVTVVVDVVFIKFILSLLLSLLSFPCKVFFSPLSPYLGKYMVRCPNINTELWC